MANKSSVKENQPVPLKYLAIFFIWKANSQIKINIIFSQSVTNDYFCIILR